jgi:hypothetical protein
MPISSIIDQPGANSLRAAYRPIVLKAEATTAGDPPPVVYCDIYFNGRFYKTISKTVFHENLGDSTAWRFDIQDACQEYLGKVIGANGGSVIITAHKIMLKVFFRFRASSIDVNGFVEPEAEVPVQGTLYTQPVPGTGEQSNTFFVCNATLQHAQNQDLPAHLNAYKRRTWNAAAFPATHRPDNYKVGLDQSDYFPVFVPEAVCPAKYRLRYKYLGQSTVWSNTTVITEPCTASIISVNGFPDDLDFAIVWEAAGNASSYLYSLDGATAISTANNFVILSGLADGPHSIVITPLCTCGEGAPTTYNFTI